MGTKWQQQSQTPWAAVKLENSSENIALNIPSLISTNNQHTAFLDSGASGHYIQEDAPVKFSKKQDPAILVRQPG
eukprot:10398964-Ditylum_brightwellii.AAC.1